MIRTPIVSPGDVVTLRSGGPRMTVVLVSSAGPGAALAPGTTTELALCLWFHGEEVRTHSFPPVCLAVVEAVADRVVPDGARAKHRVYFRAYSDGVLVEKRVNRFPGNVFLRADRRAYFVDRPRAAGWCAP